MTSTKEIGFLEDVRRRMSVLSPGRKNLGQNPIFSHRVQDLDGFRLGFMHPKVFETLCKKHGLDPATSEAILMQTDCITEPHVHAVGQSVFMPLGPDEGFDECVGGTFVDYRLTTTHICFAFREAYAGQPFTIQPKFAHFFTPGRGKRFSALAFVTPRIQKSDGGFDIMPLGRPFISRDGKEALIERTSDVDCSLMLHR